MLFMGVGEGGQQTAVARVLALRAAGAASAGAGGGRQVSAAEGRGSAGRGTWTWDDGGVPGGTLGVMAAGVSW